MKTEGLQQNEMQQHLVRKGKAFRAKMKRVGVNYKFNLRGVKRSDWRGAL